MSPTQKEIAERITTSADNALDVLSGGRESTQVGWIAYELGRISVLAELLSGDDNTEPPPFVGVTRVSVPGGADWKYLGITKDDESVYIHSNEEKAS